MDDFTHCLWYRGLRMHLGQWRYKQLRYAKKLWRVQHPEPVFGYTCALCGSRCTPTRISRKRSPKAHDFTIDHIIPVAKIIELDLDIKLWWDPKNFQAAHALCNSYKSDAYLTDRTVRKEHTTVNELPDPQYI